MTTEVLVEEDEPDYVHISNHAPSYNVTDFDKVLRRYDPEDPASVDMTYKHVTDEGNSLILEATASLKRSAFVFGKDNTCSVFVHRILNDNGIEVKAITEPPRTRVAIGNVSEIRGLGIGADIVYKEGQTGKLELRIAHANITIPPLGSSAKKVR